MLFTTDHSSSSSKMLAFHLVVLLVVGVTELVALTDKNCEESLGLDWYLPTEERLPDEQISASSEQSFSLASYGRFRNKARDQRNFGVWCPDKKDTDPWWQVDFLSMRSVTQIAMGSTDYAYGYVTKFSLSFSYNGKEWYQVKDPKTNKSKVFLGVGDLFTKELIVLDFPVTARFFRIYPKAYHQIPCLQADFRGCKPEKDCNKPIGITSSLIIPDSAMTSSSFHNRHPASSGRLNGTTMPAQSQWGAWCADKRDNAPYLQIDLRYVREVSKLEIQGHPFRIMSSWVTRYTFNYSVNGVDWTSYGKTIYGNIDIGHIKANTLNETVKARFIRFLPVKWEGDMPCLRVEAYECIPRKESIPKLEQGLKDQTINRGKALNLHCMFSGQPNITLVWKVNQQYLRTDHHRIITSETVTKHKASSTLFVTRVTDREAGEISCVAWYPTLQSVSVKSTALITVPEPVPYLNVVNFTASESILYLNHTGPYTRDVIGYRVRVTSVDGVINYDFPYNNTGEVTLTKLRPYCAYNFKVAMMYLEDEFSKFIFPHDIETPQDKPYGAPLNLHVIKISHDALSGTWEDPAIKLRNGPIIYHDVRYVKSDKNDVVYVSSRLKRKSTNSDGSGLMKIQRVFNRTVVLSNLDPGAIYEISVRSFTKMGAGPWVHPPELVFTGKATEELRTMNRMVITDANAAAVSNRLKNITADRKFLNKFDVVFALDILEKVVDNGNTSGEIGKSLVEAISNILKANKTVLSESEITNKTGTRFVKLLEKWLEGVDPTERRLEEESENVIVQKVFLNKHKLEEGIKFAKVDKEKSVEMTIPKEAIPENSTADSIFFVYYKKNKFFNGKKRMQELCIDGFTVIKERIFTPVVSGEVTGQATRNLTVPVVLKFKHNEDVNKLRETACAYWDYKADDEKGGWSTEGCTVESVANQTITCHCNHLTNFAAMMDVYAQTSHLCGNHQKIISYITVIGCFLSLIGLFLTFLTYFVFRRLLREMPAKLLIQLCVALFIVILTFVTGIEQTDKPMMCMAVAFVLHYFTLVSFFWMLMEASFMYHAFVRVWPPRQGGDIYKSTIVAWGIPLFIVGITFLTSMDSYGGKHYCHLTGTPLIASYLAPIGLIILINFVIFIFIMLKLATRPNSNTDQNSLHRATARLRRAFGIMILMGLTWSFGFGSVTNARLEFSYLFSIANASQGFFIFIFYCVAQKRARAQWYAFFTCDGRSENKRHTDSFYSERHRMSSVGSNRTSSMHFNRLDSDASSIMHGNRNSNGYAMVPPEKFTSPMNTIDELDSPIRTFDDEPPLYSPPPPDNHPSVPLVKAEKEQPLLAIDDLVTAAVDVIDDSLDEDEEDELLNKKLQESEENRKQKKDTKQYISYRALSGAKSYDVLNSVKTPSGKSLDKNTLQRRSMEVIFRKESSAATNQNRNSRDPTNRRSLIDMSTNRVSYQSARDANNDHGLKTTKSMEHINKKESFKSQIPSTEIDLTSYRKIDTIAQRDKIPRNTILPTTCGRQQSFDRGTLKSDAATMTDDVVTARPPSYGDVANKQPLRHNSSVKSKNDVMAWLKNCDDAVHNDDDDDSKEKEYDSDYSSSFYKTSPSSSLTDVSPTKCDRQPTINDGENVPGDSVMGPLSGNGVAPTTTLSNHHHHGDRNQNTDYNNTNNTAETCMGDSGPGGGKSSDFSEEEGAYSASEEDVFDRDDVSNSTPLVSKTPVHSSTEKPRGQHHQRNNTNSFKRQLSTNGFVKLEDKDGKPTSYV